MQAKSFESSEIKYEKRTIKEIYKDAETINVEVAAKEILTWTANNVEQFIDNQKRKFKLDLVIDAEEGAQETFPETRKLQNLYRAIPEDSASIVNPKDIQDVIDNLSEEEIKEMEDIQHCREALDEISENIWQSMKQNEELLEAIFKRMAFYYEMKGINKGELLLQELKGEVDIVKFEYESFPVQVHITDSALGDTEREVVKDYVIPEGFTVWLEIAFKPKKQLATNLF
ncbi:MAG: hypothetical protein WC119_01605 [Synergistaceae bacterium]